MAVEARHISLFPPQILGNRDLICNEVEGIGNGDEILLGNRVVAPLSRKSTAPAMMVPMYGSTMGNVPTKTVVIESESGVTDAVPDSRKHSRDTMNSMVSSLPGGIHNQIANSRCGSLNFLGADFSFQFLQQQLEIDRFIAQQTEKMSRETEERRKRFSRSVAATVEESLMKKLKVKEEEIHKMGKLNMALEERVKSLCVENQIWRDLAQTNEATANALRCNLEQVLAQVQDDQNQQQQQCHRDYDAALADDAQSSCGSNFNDGSTDRRTLADAVCDLDFNDNNIRGGWGCNSNRNRMCRSCGDEESSVLLLPCRHLCLCTFCGSSVHICPVCNSSKTASVHINLTS